MEGHRICLVFSEILRLNKDLSLENACCGLTGTFRKRYFPCMKVKIRSTVMVSVVCMGVKIGVTH